MLYIVYLDLSPGLKNKFSVSTHKAIIESLRSFFEKDKNFFNAHPDYNLMFTISTKADVLVVYQLSPGLVDLPKALLINKKEEPTTIKKEDINYPLFNFPALAASNKLSKKPRVPIVT